jgi:hypothetical protein
MAREASSAGNFLMRSDRRHRLILTTNEKGRAMRVLRAFFVIAAALMLTGLCLGETATYTETITASGTVGNSSFTNELVTLTATGDTSNIFELNNSPGTATFSANVASPAPEPSSLVLSASGAPGWLRF